MQPLTLTSRLCFSRGKGSMMHCERALRGGAGSIIELSSDGLVDRRIAALGRRPPDCNPALASSPCPPATLAAQTACLDPWAPLLPVGSCAAARAGGAAPVQGISRRPAADSGGGACAQTLALAVLTSFPCWTGLRQTAQTARPRCTSSELVSAGSSSRLRASPMILSRYGLAPRSLGAGSGASRGGSGSSGCRLPTSGHHMACGELVWGGVRCRIGRN